MRSIIGCLALAALVGCRGQTGDHVGAAEAPLPPRRDVLALFPPPPFSRLNDTTGTAEAQHREYGTLLSVDSLHQYYRSRAQAAGWQLQSDATSDSVLTMYFTKDSSTVWLRAWHADPFSRFSLIGSTSRPDSSRGIRPPRHR